MRALFAMLALCAAASCASVEAGSNDRAELIALDQAYAANWARGDADAVMGLFAEDAVIIPHDGDPPRVGRDAIRAFWFPSGIAPVAVSQFEHRATDVSIRGDSGIVWGRFSLAFAYEGQSYAYDGNFLLAARKEHDGVWRITHLTWNDPPPRVTPLTD